VLDACAVAVVFGGAVIGCSSLSDANEFHSLRRVKKAEVIAEWRNAGGT